jgi:hypothetical protein
MLLEINENLMIDISEPDKFNWNFTFPKKEDEDAVLR